MISLQLHLPERKLFPIGRPSVHDRYVYRSDNIHWASLSQSWFHVYKLHSLAPNLLGYSKHLNLTAFSNDKKSPGARVHGRYPQSTMWDSVKL